MNPPYSYEEVLKALETATDETYDVSWGHYSMGRNKDGKYFSQYYCGCSDECSDYDYDVYETAEAFRDATKHQNAEDFYKR